MSYYKHRLPGRLLAYIIVILMSIMLVGCADGVDTDLEDGEPGSDIAELLSRDESAELLNKQALNGGYEMVMEYTVDDETITVTIGQTDKATWYVDQEGNGVGYLLADNACHAYSCDAGEWVYSYSDTSAAYKNSINITTGAMQSYLYAFSSYASFLKKTGTEKVSGRTCDVYEYNIGTEMLGMGGSYKFYIDSEYGFLMKLDISATEGLASETASFCVTSFKTGVSAPNFPEPGMDMVDLYDLYGSDEDVEWPESDLADRIPEPYGTLEYIEDGPDSFMAIVSGMSQEDFEDYVGDLQDYDFEGALQTIEGVLYYNGEDNTGTCVSLEYYGGTMEISVYEW